MKERMIILCTISAIFILTHLSAHECIAGKKYNLEYNAGSRDGFRIDIVRLHRNERVIMGNELVSNSTDRYGYGFSVLSSDKEGVMFEVEYLERIHETDDQMVQQGPDFSELIGKKVSFLLSPTGEASQFEGFAELPLIRIVDEQRELDEQLYILDIRELFPGLPGKKVGIGDSWMVTRNYKEPAGDNDIDVKIVFTYTVAGTKKIDGHDCVMVDGTFDVLVSGLLTEGGLDLEVKLDGTGVETFAFALKKGMILQGNSELTIDGAAANEEVGVSFRFEHEYKVELTTTF